MTSIAYQISQTLGDHAQDFNINAIEEEITTTYGDLTNIDDVPSDKYWTIVERHDTTA